MRNAQAIPVIFDQRSGSLQGQLPAAGGLLVVAYNFGFFYRPFISGHEATVAQSGLPFVLVSKPPSDAGGDILELRPQTRSIWLLLLSGLLLGSLILGVTRWLCLRTERSCSVNTP